MSTKLPAPDHILVTHGHYDHMDVPTLSSFAKETHVITPLGYDDLFGSLGMNRRTRLDWFDSFEEDGREITLLPCDHWTMRNPLVGPNRSLWGSYRDQNRGRSHDLCFRRHRLLSRVSRNRKRILHRFGHHQSRRLRAALDDGCSSHESGRGSESLQRTWCGETDGGPLGNLSPGGRTRVSAAHRASTGTGKRGALVSLCASRTWKNSFPEVTHSPGSAIRPEACFVLPFHPGGCRERGMTKRWWTSSWQSLFRHEFSVRAFLRHSWYNRHVPLVTTRV